MSSAPRVNLFEGHRTVFDALLGIELLEPGLVVDPDQFSGLGNQLPFIGPALHLVWWSASVEAVPGSNLGLRFRTRIVDVRELGLGEVDEASSRFLLDLLPGLGDVIDPFRQSQFFFEAGVSKISGADLIT